MFKDLFSKFRPILESLPLKVSEDQFLDSLEVLYLKHKEINDIHNLTRITSKEDFFEKHIVDSLMIGLVDPDILTNEFKIADVGCGGGFPCLPLSMVNSDLQISGVESLGKKVSAVNEIAEHCGFENLRVHKYRAREAGRLEGFNAAFDIVTARAVATAEVLIKECRQMVKPGGRMIFYKTPEAIEKEMKLAERDSKKHKFSLELSEKFLLSEESGERQFFILTRNN